MSTFFESLSVTQLAAQWAALFLPLVVKSSVVLGLLLLSTRWLRNASASTRHFLWAVGTAGLLLLPFLQTGLPQWRVVPTPTVGGVPLVTVHEVTETARAPHRSMGEMLPPDGRMLDTQADAAETAAGVTLVQRNTTGSDTGVMSSVASALALPPVVWAFAFWLAGMVVLAAAFGCGMVRLARLAHEATPLDEDGWQAILRHACRSTGLSTPPALLWSPRALTPMTWGVRRPVVLLPSECRSWSIEKAREILVHELAHIHRRDCVTQLGAQLLCLIHWFNPLVWVAARRMRLERERACDDSVLMSGSRPSSYATHLLDIAKQLGSEGRTLSPALAMARRSRIFDRLDAVLDPRLHRLAPGRRQVATSVALACAVFLPLATLGPSAQAIDERGTSRSRHEVPDPPDPPDPPDAPEPPPSPETWSDLPALPALPSLPALPTIPSVSTGGWSHIRKDGSTVQVSWTNDETGVHWRMESEGEIDFKDDDSGIERMGEGSRFELEERNGRRRIEVEATPGEGGRPVYAYWVDRKAQPFDQKAAQWLADGLQHTLLELGINAPRRVHRTFEREGARGVLKLIDRVESDYAGRIYYTEYFSLDGLRDEDIRAGLEQMSRNIDSDYEMACVLATEADVLMASKGSTEAFARCVSSIDSDYEKARVLTTAFAHRDLAPDEAAIILHAASSIDSDYEAARVLNIVDPASLADETLSRAFFTALDGIDSDYEKARVLVGVARHVGDNEKLREACLRAADGIDSSYEHSRVERALR